MTPRRADVKVERHVLDRHVGTYVYRAQAELILRLVQDCELLQRNGVR